MTDHYNTRHDHEQEQIELAQRERHERGECEGAPVCGVCLDLVEARQMDIADLEDSVYQHFARIYPHECFDIDPERFWQMYHAKYPDVSRADMERALRDTRGGVKVCAQCGRKDSTPC